MPSPRNPSPYRSLLQQIVDSSVPEDQKGVALYRRAERFLGDSCAEDRQFHALMREILLYAAARRQRVAFSPKAEQMYLDLEALIEGRLSTVSTASTVREDSLVSA